MEAPASTATVETVTPDVTPPAAPAPEKAAPPAPEPKAPETPSGGDQKQELLTRQEARRAARKQTSERRAQEERARKDREAAATAQPDARGKKHREDGTFLPGQSGEEKKQEAEGAQPAATQDTTPPAADKPQGEEKTPDADKAAADKPAGTSFKVEIDPKHPVAGMGVPEITTGSEQEAQVVRALLNGVYTRREELRAAQTELRTLQAKNRELQDRIIEHDSNASARKKFTSTPEYRERVSTYNAILEEHGEAAAKDYWKGVETEYNKFLDGERQTQVAAARAEEEKAHEQRWRTQELDHARAVLGDAASIDGFDKWFTEEVDLFNARLEMGHFTHLDVEPRNQEEAERLDRATRLEFRRQLGARLQRHPEFVAAASKRKADTSKAKADDAKARADAQKDRDRELEQARREGAEAARREAAQARVDTPPSPIASLPAPDSRRTGVTTGAEPVDTSHMGAGTLRKHSRQQARDMGRRRLQQQ